MTGGDDNDDDYDDDGCDHNHDGRDDDDHHNEDEVDKFWAIFFVILGAPSSMNKNLHIDNSSK